MRLTIEIKWSPEADPCLSSMSVQVKVGCMASFPQLVKYIYEGVYLDHNGILPELLMGVTVCFYGGHGNILDLGE